eukprot:NODE_33821_length_277_cov_2.546667.p1 GENE.NODE_33821_length_277_cov_2.546667~~NODE_33821_length_277_cov_2.546667.p1  ORF type:complete len:55 (+),score=5.37 NODE_33821_length_277_cov_2.546667:35-199(+)
MKSMTPAPSLPMFGLVTHMAFKRVASWRCCCAIHEIDDVGAVLADVWLGDSHGV